MPIRQLKTPVGEASLAQSKALAITPKVSSILSLLGSTYIIYDVYKMRASKRRMYHQILLGMSITDVLASTAWFFTTWPIPPDVFPVWGASGTQATCTAQGFFAQFSIATVFYNGFLALHYLLVIRFGWTEDHIRRARLRYIIHGVSLSAGIVTAAVSAAKGLINPIGWDCWISAVPLGCAESWQNNGETNCTRGDNASLYQWIFFYLPLWVIIFLVTVAMLIVYTAYKKQVSVARGWSKRWTTTNSNTSNRNSARVSGSSAIRASKIMSEPKRLLTTQMILYVGSFYFVWMFPTILRITELTGDTVWWHWNYLSAMCVPCQGALNLIVYLRPRFVRQRSRNQRRESSMIAPQKSHSVTHKPTKPQSRPGQSVESCDVKPIEPIGEAEPTTLTMETGIGEAAPAYSDEV